MIYGYARTSTADQKAGLDAQRRDLWAADCGCVQAEEASAVGERPLLDAILAQLGKGDVLVVTKLDRLARSVVHLGQLLEMIHAAGASLRILNLGMDTSTPTGKLMLNVLGSVAQFEREMMLERQREGIEVARAAGKYRGRLSRNSKDEVRAFVARWEESGCSRSGGAANAAMHFGLSVRQVQRILKG